MLVSRCNLLLSRTTYFIKETVCCFLFWSIRSKCCTIQIHTPTSRVMMICFTQMSHQFLHLHARVIDLLLPLLAYSMYAGNVISHDPNFAQSNSAWSKSCSIQIFHNTNFAWSKHCIIQILHDPNFARSKFCTIQTMHDPNVVESVFFFLFYPPIFWCVVFFTHSVDFFILVRHGSVVFQYETSWFRLSEKAAGASNEVKQPAWWWRALAPTHYSTGPVEREGWWVLGGGVKAGAWKDEEGLSAAFTGLVGMRRHCGGGGWWRYQRHC